MKIIRVKTSLIPLSEELFDPSSEVQDRLQEKQSTNSVTWDQEQYAKP